MTYVTVVIKAVGHMQKQDVSKTQNLHGLGDMPQFHPKKKKVHFFFFNLFFSPSKHGEDDFLKEALSPQI